MNEVTSFQYCIDGGDVWPQLPAHLKGDLLSQLCASMRTVEEDARGIQRAVWRETGPDHFRHAHLYYCVAAQVAAKSAAEGGATYHYVPAHPPGVEEPQVMPGQRLPPEPEKGNFVNSQGQPIDPKLLPRRMRRS